MFDWFKRKQDRPRLVIVTGPSESAAQREVAHNRRVEQLLIQQELGIDAEDDTQAWLRLHQLLKDHEDRLRALEARPVDKASCQGT